MIQGSPEWFAARCGKVTASRVADIVARTKSGPSASRAQYEAQLIAERLTGVVEQGFSNAAMQWGTEHEAEARAAYCFRHDMEVQECAFVIHPGIPEAGASPDGLIGDDGLVEIKCPTLATHIATLQTGTVPEKYRTQMLWQMACTGREWCDFVSYDPRLPASMRLFVQRVERDVEAITKLEYEVMEFLADVTRKVVMLRRKFEPANDSAAKVLVDLVCAG
jgi:putative phage-type endonuclease